MSNIYIVQHSYEIANCEETKFIGAFSTLKKAEKIVKKYKKLPGFKDYQDKFFIDEYEMDVSEWREGFSRIKNPGTGY